MIAAMERERCLVLQMADLLAYLASCFVMHFVGLLLGMPRTQPVLLLMAGTGALWLMSLALMGAYQYPMVFRQELFGLLRGGVLSAGIVLALTPGGWLAIPQGQFLGLLGLSVLSALVSRLLLVPALLRLVGRGARVDVLIVGDSPTAERVATLFRSRNGYRLRRSGSANQLRNSQQKSATELFQADLKMHKPAEVIFVEGKECSNHFRILVQACQRAGVPWQVVPDLEHLGASDLQTLVVGGLPLIAMKGPAFHGVNLRIKQLIDIVLSLILLIAWAPIMLVVWIMIRLDSKGPALIKQPRIGYKGKVFNIYKFRTMYHNCDDGAHRKYIKQCIQGARYGEGTKLHTNLYKIANDKRVTRVGAFLRRYSLDEIPQIFNVLKLEMSLVGPRPSLAYELESYQEWHKERLEGIPGVTGLWQVSGRSLLSFNDMVRLDLEYLRNWSPMQDFRLLVKTIPAIFRGTGV